MNINIVIPSTENFIFILMHGLPNKQRESMASILAS